MKKVITTKSYERFKEMINKEKVSKIISPHETITKWEQAIMTIKKKCEQKPRKKHISWKQKTLMRAKRRIKNHKTKLKRVRQKGEDY